MITMEFPSIFIPRVTCQTSEQYIKEVFDYFLCGECVKKVDLIIKEDGRTGKMYQIAFVHFTKVPETEETKELKEKLEKGESVMLTYNYPWYWVLRKNTSAERREKGRPRLLSEKDMKEIKAAQELLRCD